MSHPNGDSPGGEFVVEMDDGTTIVLIVEPDQCLPGSCRPNWIVTMIVNSRQVCYRTSNRVSVAVEMVLLKYRGGLDSNILGDRALAIFVENIVREKHPRLFD